MRKRESGAALQLSGLILATILCVEAISFALVLGMPAPEPQQITIRMAADALRGTADPTDPVRSRLTANPPDGARATLVEDAMVSLYGISRDKLRVTWVGNDSLRIQGAMHLPGRDGQTDSGRTALIGSAERGGDGEARPERQPRLPIVEGAPRVAVLPDITEFSDQLFSTLEQIPIPPFRVALQQDDGEWLTIEPREPLLTVWQIQMLAAFLISAVLLVPIAVVAARRFTRPLRKLARIAASEEDAETAEFPVSSTHEIRAAFDAIVRMRARLARRADQRVRILAAVAHDLRTPMTGLRLRVEDAAEPDRTQMIEDLDRMEDMIGHMLRYARDGVEPVALEPIDVNRAVSDVAASFPPGSVAVVRLAEERVNLLADRGAFERAVGNLVQNAIDYGGDVEIDVRASSGSAAILVQDRGPGIPAEDRARLLMPFERGDGSRSRETGGVGLGLTTVAEFAERYGGEISLTDRLGGGLTAQLTFETSNSSGQPFSTNNGVRPCRP